MHHIVELAAALESIMSWNHMRWRRIFESVPFLQQRAEQLRTCFRMLIERCDG